MVADIYLKIVDSNTSIDKKIAQGLVEEMNKFIKERRVKEKLLIETKRVIISRIKDTPEYASLISSSPESLHGQLGITDPVGRCEALFEVWGNEIVVTPALIQARGSTISGTIFIKAIEADFHYILGTAAAWYWSRSKKGEETRIPWLEWLLLMGKGVIVKTHFYATNPKYNTRTGLGYMAKENKDGKTQTQPMWSIQPSEYAGTMSKNWITRALKDSESDIIYLFSKALMGKL